MRRPRRTRYRMRNVDIGLLFRDSVRQRSAVRWGGGARHPASRRRVAFRSLNAAACVTDFTMEPTFEDNLIQLVRSYPPLYKAKDNKMETLTVKERYWREIGEKLHRTPGECKTKWRNLRDNYRKYQNKKKVRNTHIISKFDDEKLKFIYDSFEERECTSKAIKVCEEDSLRTEMCEPIPSTLMEFCDPLQSFLELNSNTPDHNEDTTEIGEPGNTPVHTFFSSMADVVCRFPPEKIAEIRTRVCDIVTEMELLMLGEEAPSPRHAWHLPQP
ncbi:unnamed protein product [Chrysodeixis includens]|uniref:MADF domain-containing protein n=1 Tax=Chrysodeixis includens TaxID=689277 RepID=A0A9P0FW52_CHRIL|nr:unnamed protein product [Chrysodeixis includens]